jgi:hypothetical protein
MFTKINNRIVLYSQSINQNKPVWHLKFLRAVFTGILNSVVEMKAKNQTVVVNALQKNR